jgi:trigger factor
MKTMMIKLLTLLLVLVMTVSLFACQAPKDDQTPEDSPNSSEGGNKEEGDQKEEQKDPATDGVFDYNDYDSKKDYQLPNYAELNITEYITLGKYKKFKVSIEEERYTITDELLNNRINTILGEHHPDAKITNRAVAWKDVVVVDYVGKKDGVAFDRGSAQNQTIAVEEKNSYIPGFVEGLVGAMPGTTFDVPVTFPDDYPTADMAGQDAVFTFTVHYIIGDPKLTDEFVAQYTEGEFTSAEEFKVDLRADMQQQAYDACLRSAFWKKIAENAAAEKYPEDAVMYYYGYYYNMYSYYAAYYGWPLDLYLQLQGITLADLFAACCDVVKGDMVYYAVFAAEGFEYTEEQYQKALETYTEANIDSLNELMTQAGKETYDFEGAKAYFDENEHDLLELQTLEEIAYNALIGDITIEIIPIKTEEKK